MREGGYEYDLLQAKLSLQLIITTHSIIVDVNPNSASKTTSKTEYEFRKKRGLTLKFFLQDHALQ